MHYTAKTRHEILHAPDNLGNRLARRAIDLDFSVMRIAQALGATRQTVYNWLSGKDVISFYRPRVEQLITVLNSTDDLETAWSKVCKEVHLPT